MAWHQTRLDKGDLKSSFLGSLKVGILLVGKVVVPRMSTQPVLDFLHEVLQVLTAAPRGPAELLETALHLHLLLPPIACRTLVFSWSLILLFPPVRWGGDPDLPPACKVGDGPDFPGMLWD